VNLGQLDVHVDISIIIVNWNTKNFLQSCLTSIVRHTSACSMEIVVVDNGSSDGSVDMVRRVFPEVRLLVNDRNQGFAAANNRGLSHAHGRYLLLLNSDTVVLPDAFEDMIHYMDAHPHVGALGPRLLNEDGSLQISVRDFPRLDHDAAMMLNVKHWPIIGNVGRRYMQQTYLPNPERISEVDWVMGACLLLRREAIEQVGLLDNEYFFFFEEVDLCYRLRRHGWPVVFLGTARIVHLGGQSRGRIPAPSLVWYYKGLLRFYRLRYSRQRYLALRIGVAVGATAHMLWLLARRRRSHGGRPLLAAYARILAYAVTG